jgi:hypothetical protein
VRTVARHGYQFVFREVVEEGDAAELLTTTGHGLPTSICGTDVDPAGQPRADINDIDPFPPLVDRLLRRGPWQNGTEADRREAAEQLHALGTAEALKRLEGMRGAAQARAILRDTRWDVAGAGAVPIIGAEGTLNAALAVAALRLRRAARLASSRWASASAGGALAGVVAGGVGGMALWLGPQSGAGFEVVLALALVGGLAGAVGAAGIGAGLAGAEALARSHRASALALCGAGGGMAVGGLAHLLGRAIVSGLFGRDLASIGGGVEGLVLGAAAGVGYAVSTSPLPGGGMAAPRGPARTRTALVTGATCALAAVILSLANRHLVASSLDVMAAAFEGSKVGLAPIAQLLGEEQLRPVTRMVVSAFEGLMLGAGIAIGLTRRPRIEDDAG